MFTTENFQMFFAEGVEAGKSWAASHAAHPAIGLFQKLAAIAGDGPSLGHMNEAADNLESLVGVGVISVPVDSEASAALVEGFLFGAIE